MVTEPREEVRWSPPTRIAFRFFFSYFVLLFVSEGASGAIRSRAMTRRCREGSFTGTS